MDHTIAVLPEADVLDEAYSMGWNALGGQRDEPADEPSESLSYFTEGAEYINTITPKLRALSGYVDSDTRGSSYRVERPVVVVPQGREDDLPRDGVRKSIEYVHNTVLEAWRSGALDSLAANEYGENDDVQLCEHTV